MWWSPEPGPGSPTHAGEALLRADRPGRGARCFSVLTVTGPAADTSGEFNLNGIAATPDGRTLIVAHSATEALYTVDPVTGASTLLASIPGPDGILYEAGRLWVAQPFLNQVTRLRLSPDLTGAVVEEIITSPCSRRRRPSRFTAIGWPRSTPSSTPAYRRPQTSTRS